MRKYYLVTTEHLEESLWFRDNEDFVTGMNYVAIQAALMPEVVVLVFILMSNHVLFVLYGIRADVEAFVAGQLAALQCGFCAAGIVCGCGACGVHFPFSKTNAILPEQFLQGPQAPGGGGREPAGFS